MNRGSGREFPCRMPAEVYGTFSEAPSKTKTRSCSRYEKGADAFSIEKCIRTLFILYNREVAGYSISGSVYNRKASSHGIMPPLPHQ